MECCLPTEPAWPERLRHWISETYGPPAAVERLAGMSLNGVWRVRFNDASVIVKAGPSATESRFYEHVAQTLRAASVPSPDLYMVFHEPESHWLVIEDIPTPLPIAQTNPWQPDERVIAILARLHATTRAVPPDLPEIEPNDWRPTATQAALGCLPAEQVATLAPILERLQQEHAVLDEDWCWISGDPNPRNWGLRDDGTPVLFDWELIAPGVPATDLAIIVPGLGSPSDYAGVATAYLAARDTPEPLPWDAATLARQIAVAKVATVVQLLDSHASGSASVSEEFVRWLASAIPAWLGAVHDFATTSGSS